MKVLITGICGFVGSAIASRAMELNWGWQIIGIDNLSRPGSDRNRKQLKSLGIEVRHGDIRCASDLESIGPVDWVLDAAANPSVLAGVDGRTSSRQLIEHNLSGTINLLEYCKSFAAGLVLLSTSRVYSIQPLASLRVKVDHQAFVPEAYEVTGLTPEGIAETFSIAPPVSLYGATKVASELLALEYASTFKFPCRINRCGVLAGAGQFGRVDQGIFAFWIHSHLQRRKLQYIGFDGQGHQVRDCLHPYDLANLVNQQFHSPEHPAPQVVNVSGGIGSATSLKQLTDWCDQRFGVHPVVSNPAPRPFDLPWVVLDSALAKQHWNWSPQISQKQIFEEIAVHAEFHPDWLDISV